MKKFVFALGVAAIAVTASAPVFAREVKQVVGYVTTEQIVTDRDAEFRRLDTSGDGAVNFKEFQRGVILENEYEVFKMNDTNNDDLLTIDEFRVFSKSGPAKVSEGPSHTNYNFNKGPINK